MVTPRILSEFLREMLGSDGGGGVAVFRLGFRKTISLVFATFSLCHIRFICIFVILFLSSVLV